MFCGHSRHEARRFEPISIFKQGYPFMGVSNTSPVLSRATNTSAAAPDDEGKLKPLPRPSDLAVGPGMERHRNMYNKVFGAAVNRRLQETYASKTLAKQIETLAKHKEAKNELGSAKLLGATALTLGAEAAVHHIGDLHKHAARAGIGFAQKHIGMVGAGYYLNKFIEDRDPRTALMATGYLLFNAEGFARMWEGAKPHMPMTGNFGMMSAATKMVAAWTPLGTFSYLPDLAANAIESRHNTDRPTKEGFARALWQLGHSMKSKHISLLQAAAAVGMSTNAGSKTYKYLSTKPEQAEVKEVPAPEDVEFNKTLENFINRLGQDSEFCEKLSALCKIEVQEEFEGEFSKLFETCR
jgi:hypothetical protein